MHFFAFLGNGNYEPCFYEFTEPNDAFTRSALVQFIQTAVAHYYRRDLQKITIFATVEAQKEHKQSLIDEFKKNQITIKPNFVLVPSGFDRPGMLSLFEILNEHLTEDLDLPLVFDLTHGFRSQPALGLMILNYLQSVYPSITVQDILYGAFTFRPRPKDGEPALEPQVAPVVSLMELWELNEWAAGFRSFQQSGDVAPITSLLAESQNRAYRRLDGTRPSHHPQVKSFSSSLEKWATEVQLCAIPQMFESKGSLDALKQDLDKEWNPFSLELGRFAEPLRLEIKSLIDRFHSDNYFDIDGLRSQLHLLRWLLDHHRYQQFITIAREWLLTVIMLKRELNPNIKADRDKGEELYGLMRHELKDTDTDTYNDFVSQYGHDFIGLCDAIRELRNKINHGWHGEHSRDDAIKTATSADKIEPYLQGLFKIWTELAGVTLLSPLGTSPGALFTAAIHHRPSRILIVTNEECIPNIETLKEALQSEGLSPEVFTALVKDPYADVQGAIQAARSLAYHIDGLPIANLAGGTTALQEAIRALAHQSQAYTGFSLDPRSLTEQIEAPFTPGSWQWISAPPEL